MSNTKVWQQAVNKYFKIIIANKCVGGVCQDSFAVFLIFFKPHLLSLLASKRSVRDTIRGVQIRVGVVYVYFICMEVRVAQ